MIPDEKNGVRFFRFSALQGRTGVCHGVLTRNEGVLGGAEDSFVPAQRNRALILRVMSGGDPVFARQVHGSAVLTVGAGAPPAEPLEGDAMITDAPGKILAIQVADCQPVLLYDPVRRAVGNIHSGWRGSVANIIGRTVRAMQERFGTRPGDLLAGIGPSLGPCCAEFLNYRQEIPEQYHAFRDHRDHFDLWAISRLQLRRAGVREENMETTGLCTRCNPDLFYSWRGEKTAGRFVAVIGLT